MAKNSGKEFEEQIKNSVPPDVYYERIKDPPASFGKDSSSVRFSLKNPYDTYAYKYPFMYAMELKSTKGKSIPFSFTDNKSSIKKCQIEGLRRASEYKGICAGFLLNFRNEVDSEEKIANDNTYWFRIELFLMWASACGKKSINEKDVIEFGGIKIPQILKVKKYKYDLNIIFK